MSQTRACPNCGGAQTTKGKVDQWRYLNAFDFVPMAPWTCGACGHVWEPPPLTWLLALLLALGFLGLGLTAVSFSIGSGPLLRRILLGVMSIALIASCIAKMRDRAPKTLTQGRIEKNQGASP
jgi:hypothetical protein